MACSKLKNKVILYEHIRQSSMEALELYIGSLIQIMMSNGLLLWKDLFVIRPNLVHGLGDFFIETKGWNVCGW